jgi:methylphosphotriester-DNA--protein-cysteine methyltransferase
VRSAHAGIYRSCKQCKPEEAPAYLAEALNVLRAVTRS